MARDRLAAMRAQQQGMGGTNNSYPTQASGDGYGASRYGQQQYGSSYEMSDRTYGTPPVTAGGDAMSAFYSEITSIQNDIQSFNDNVTKIGSLHARSLNNMDDNGAADQQEIADLVDETSALSATLKRRIKGLEAQGASGKDGQIRSTQVGRVKKNFMDAIQAYQREEQTHRHKHKQRLERQYKIVKPNASPDEIKAVVENENNSQIFSQALMNSQFGSAQSAYREVQARQEDIKRIEKTLAELAQLFNDMSILVEQQHETIETIETQAVNVHNDTEAAYKHTEDAVKSAAAARKKRWICFIIIIVVVIIIVGAVAGTLVSRANQNKTG